MEKEEELSKPLMDAPTGSADEPEVEAHVRNNRQCFGISLIVITVILIVTHAAKSKYDAQSIFVDYETFGAFAQLDIELEYSYYLPVAAMIFLGFGFLMTFLRSYSFSAVGLNFLLTCITMLWSPIAHSAANAMIKKFIGDSGTIGAGILGVNVMTEGLFVAAAVAISYGALLGRASGTQMLWLAVFEGFFFQCLDITLEDIGITDIGGSLGIHAFGAYFGLAASWMLSVGKKYDTADHPKCGSTYLNDVFAMIGTLVLWIYWPSFVAALVPNPIIIEPSPPPIGIPLSMIDSQARTARFLCIMNTVLSLLGSCLSAFAVSSLLPLRKGKEQAEGPLDMVHIQNATLAGGVAIGAVADLIVTPAVSILVGVIAGSISTLGYIFLTPYLQSRISLFDTCGVHNLHGMPGLLGGIVSAFAVAHPIKKHASETFLEVAKSAVSGHIPVNKQVSGIFATLGFGLISGGLSGLVARFLPGTPEAMMYDDTTLWKE